ncbi:transcriptional repressor [Dehalococcoidia bacterium]|nr:transcriptional repressor [Dehalococcoidia bacterium]MCL0072739.1 transcriptional repressor [Dehalococcoidia bacterium]
MRPSAKKIASLLSQKGYKLTAQRRAVIDVVVNSHEHLAPAALYERVRRTHPAIGLVTVYRTLEMLHELGLICRVHRGEKHGYTLAPSGHHHHLVCAQCGTVADFTGCELEVLQQRLSQETGFKIEGHLLQFVGHCRNCQGGT